MAEIRRCKNAFAMEVDGVTRVVPAGELISSEDPVYNSETSGYFEDVTEHVGQRSASRVAAVTGVEQATADPGEKRSVGRPAKKTAASKPEPKSDGKPLAEA